MRITGQEKGTASKVAKLLTITSGKFDFPANFIVDLTPVFTKMNATNNIKIDVKTGSKIYKGSLTLTADEDREVVALSNMLVQEYQQSLQTGYTVVGFSSYYGDNGQ